MSGKSGFVARAFIPFTCCGFPLGAPGGVGLLWGREHGQSRAQCRVSGPGVEVQLVGPQSRARAWMSGEGPFCLACILTPGFSPPSSQTWTERCTQCG